MLTCSYVAKPKIFSMFESVGFSKFESVGSHGGTVRLRLEERAYG